MATPTDNDTVYEGIFAADTKATTTETALEPVKKEAGIAPIDGRTRTELATALATDPGSVGEQTKEIARLCKGAENIPDHVTIGMTVRTDGSEVEECDINCERCKLITIAETNLITRDKGDLFGEYGGVGF